jgi:hypothetical protein
VAEGFTLTVFLRASPGIDGAILLDNQPTDTIDQARGIVYLIAKERSIPENEVPSISACSMSDRRAVLQTKPAWQW